MDIKIYTSSTCYFCSQLKKLLERANITDYEEVICHANNEAHVKFKEDYPHVQSFPHVIIDGEEIGSLVQTAKFLLDKDLVSSKKNNGQN